MRELPGKPSHKLLKWTLGGLFLLILPAGLSAEDLSLQALVTPSTIVLKDGHAVTFAIHGFIEFKALAEVFPYIDTQVRALEAGWSCLPLKRANSWRGNCYAMPSRAALSR
jgi:hypothetical protein